MPGAVKLAGQGGLSAKITATQILPLHDHEHEPRARLLRFYLFFASKISFSRATVAGFKS
jgi:hypothetical protein